MHPGSNGLLNELYLQGEQHAELAPGYKKGRRGPHVIQSVIEYLTGLKINYYVLVNLGGFKDIVNAVGGVTVNITEKKPIPIGGEIVNGRQVKPPTGYLPTGKHHLNGEQALWYGRSRDGDNDFHRMDRQKCLLKDIADQANPQQVVTHFQKLAKAAQNTVATNIPSALLPALVKLSSTVKHGADIQSLPFNPDKIPGFEPYEPNVRLMRNVVAKAIANSGHPATPTRTPSATPKKHKKKTTARTSATPGATASNGSVSLKNVCG